VPTGKKRQVEHNIKIIQQQHQSHVGYFANLSCDVFVPKQRPTCWKNDERIRVTVLYRVL